MTTSKIIRAWQEAYRKANNQEPPEVLYNGRGWWRIGEASRSYYREKDFVRFTANLRGESSIAAPESQPEGKK